LWLRRGSSGTANPPKYIDEAYNESFEARQSRNAWNSQREAQVAASQAKLKASYDADLKAVGTTHTKNLIKINSAKVAAIAVPKTIATSSTNKKLTVIPASESKKLNSSQIADKKAVAQAASTAAVKTKTIANDAKNEASAYKKAVMEKQAEIKKTANQSVKASLQKELKSLQKESNASQKRADVATDHAKAVESYSKAAASVVSSASVAAIQKLNTAAAKVDKTALASSKVGVQDHAGQVLLKNGTWLDKVQRRGANGAHEVTKIYTPTEWNDHLKTTKAALAEAQRIADNYNPVQTKAGKIIDAVQKKGASSTGEDRVTVFRTDKVGNVTARSKTANEYVAALNQAKKLASVPIVSGMAKADITAIQDARKYVNARIDNPVKFSPQNKKAAWVETKTALIADALDKLSKPGTEGQRIADSWKRIATNDLSLKEDMAAVITPYIQGGKQAVKVMDEGLALESLINVPTRLTKIANKQIANKYGQSALTRGVDQAANWVQNDSLKTMDNAVITVIDKGADYAPLALLNSYAKQKYGESKWTKRADLVKDVSKAIPTKIYKEVREKPGSTAVNVAGMYAGGAALGAVYGGVKAGAVTFIEKGFVSPLTKATLKTGVAALEGAVQGKMAYDIGGQAVSTVKTGDANKIADFTTEFIVGGAGFSKGSGYFNKKLVTAYGESTVSSYSPLTRLATIAGQATGTVRGKTVVIENAPYHPVDSQTAMIEAVIDHNHISGTRGTATYRIAQPVSGNPIGIKKFNLHGKEYTAGTTIKALKGEKDQFLTRYQTEGGTAANQARVYAADVYSSYMVPDLTGGKYQAVGVHFLSKSGKSKVNQEVQLLKDIPTVASELSAKQKALIKEQYARDGRLDPTLLKEVQRLAAEKSKRIGQPVATITPKTAAGAKPEAEVLLVFGDARSTYVTDSKRVGYTNTGIKIKELRLGTQEAIKSEMSRLENIKYNWKNALSGNDTYAEGMAAAINRKIAEESGRALMKPQQYGSHGTQHTGRVAEIMEDLWYKSPTLQKQYTLKEFKIAGRLHDAARIYGNSKMGETEPLAHGPAVAYNIRKGRIKDSELLSLTKKQQLNVAKAIETHMWLKPKSKLQRLTYRATDMQKALKTADSLARAEKAGYLKPGTTFKLPEERALFGLKQSLSKGFSAFKKDTVAEFAPHKSPVEISRLERIKALSDRKHLERGIKAKEKVSDHSRSVDEYEYARKSKKSGFTKGKNSSYDYNTKRKVTRGAYVKSARYNKNTKVSSYYKDGKSHSAVKTPYYEGIKTPHYVGIKEYEKFALKDLKELDPYKHVDQGYTKRIPGKYSPSVTSRYNGSGKTPSYVNGYKTPQKVYTTPKYTKTSAGYSTPYSNKSTRTDGYGKNASGSNPIGGVQTVKEILTILQDKKTVLKKKQSPEKISKEKGRENIKLKRKIGNRLGNLDSMFDVDVKRSSKTVKRA